MIKDVRLPEIAENVETGDVIKVMVSVGDAIAVDQPIVELETDKAVLEVPSPYQGTVSEVLVKAGDTIKIDQAIIKIDTAATTSAAAESKPESPAPKPATRQEEVPRAPAPLAPVAMNPEVAPSASTLATPTPIAPGGAAPAARAEAAPASPSLRRLARELGVDIHNVTGSGPGGRILKHDLTTYARNAVAGASASAPESPASEVTESTKWGGGAI